MIYLKIYISHRSILFESLFVFRLKYYFLLYAWPSPWGQSNKWNCEKRERMRSLFSTNKHLLVEIWWTEENNVSFRKLVFNHFDFISLTYVVQDVYRSSDIICNEDIIFKPWLFSIKLSESHVLFVVDATATEEYNEWRPQMVI